MPKVTQCHSINFPHFISLSCFEQNWAFHQLNLCSYPDAAFFLSYVREWLRNYFSFSYFIEYYLCFIIGIFKQFSINDGLCLCFSFLLEALHVPLLLFCWSDRPCSLLLAFSIFTICCTTLIAEIRSILLTSVVS